MPLLAETDLIALLDRGHRFPLFAATDTAGAALNRPDSGRQGRGPAGETGCFPQRASQARSVASV